MLAMSIDITYEWETVKNGTIRDLMETKIRKHSGGAIKLII